MNVALIFAGGTGRRMNTSSKPKQFLEMHGKPVLIYTLEHFEVHDEIDEIVMVCLASWHEKLKHMLDKYGIHKVSKIVIGGNTAHESIFNGLKAMEDIYKEDDIIVIHDGVRPLINGKLISTCIDKAKKKGAVITVEAVRESVVRIVNNDFITDIPPRDEMFIAKAPQTFKYKLILDLYKKAKNDNVLTVDSAHLCSVYGIVMHHVASPPNNMKITTSYDYYIFRALYEAMENQQILGV